MAAFAADLEVVRADSSEADAIMDINLAEGGGSIDVDGKHVVDRVHHAVFDQLLGAAGEEFFALFEDKIDRAVDEFAMMGQRFGDRHEDRSMGIVATGVHDAGIGALIGQVIRFREAQGIEISTQADGRARLAAFEDADGAVACNARHQFDTGLCQMVPDPGCRIRFMEGQFRMGMEITAVLNNLVTIFFYEFFYIGHRNHSLSAIS